MNSSDEQRDLQYARREYLKRPAISAETFLGKFGTKIAEFHIVDKLKVFSEFCGSSSDFSSSDLIRKTTEKRESAGHVSNNFANSFLRSYEDSIRGFPLVEILKIFYVFKECNGQFSVAEYIEKRRRVIS